MSVILGRLNFFFQIQYGVITRRAAAVHCLITQYFYYSHFRAVTDTQSDTRQISTLVFSGFAGNAKKPEESSKYCVQYALRRRKLGFKGQLSIISRQHYYSVHRFRQRPHHLVVRGRSWSCASTNDDRLESRPPSAILSIMFLSSYSVLYATAAACSCSMQHGIRFHYNNFT